MNPINQLWKHSEGVWSHHFSGVLGCRDLEVNGSSCFGHCRFAIIMFISRAGCRHICLNGINNSFNATDKWSIYCC